MALKRRLADEEEEAIEAIEAEIQEDGFTVEAVHHLDQEKDHLQELEATIDNRRESYLKDWESLFRQVTLFNATLIDQTALWLDAMKPNFKMGLLFSARKTAEERRKRTNELIQKLEDQLQSQLVFHLHQSLQSLPLEQMTNKEPFLNALEDLSISISEDFFKRSSSKKYIFRPVCLSIHER